MNAECSVFASTEIPPVFMSPRVDQGMPILHDTFLIEGASWSASTAAIVFSTGYVEWMLFATRAIVNSISLRIYWLC